MADRGYDCVAGKDFNGVDFEWIWFCVDPKSLGDIEAGMEELISDSEVLIKRISTGDIKADEVSLSVERLTNSFELLVANIAFAGGYELNGRRIAFFTCENFNACSVSASEFVQMIAQSKNIFDVSPEQFHVPLVDIFSDILSSSSNLINPEERFLLDIAFSFLNSIQFGLEISFCIDDFSEKICSTDLSILFFPTDSLISYLKMTDIKEFIESNPWFLVELIPLAVDLPSTTFLLQANGGNDAISFD